MLFGNCYTVAPLCVPARIALATGMLPSHTGMLGNSDCLGFDVPTYYSRLRDSGYRVGMVGKLHLSATDEHCRDGQRACLYSWGFTHPHETEGKMFAGSKPAPQGPYGQMLSQRGLYDAFHRDYAARRQRGWVLQPDDSVLPAECFHDVYIGQHAADWLRNAPTDEPWHYFVSFVGPHDPFDPPREFAQRYRDASMPPAIADGLDGKPERYRKRACVLDADHVARTRRQYCALVELIDDQIGNMLAALEARGLADNTYVVFTSDHGEMLGDHSLYTKSTPYEGAVHVPLIVAGPGVAHGVSEAMVEMFDLNPTVCELAGLAPQAGIDARSLCNVLAGRTGEHRREVVSELRGFRMIRDHRRKLVLNADGEAEFYDLASDPQELVNLRPGNPDAGEDLVKRLGERFARAS